MGMLDVFQNPGTRDELAQERLDFERAKFAAQNPFQHGRLMSYEGAQRAGEGIGRMVAGAMGRDTRTQAERNRAAVEAAKAEMAQMGEVDLATPEGRRAYYKGMQDILRRNGLPAEAHAAAQEGVTAENEALDLKIKQDAVNQRREAAAAKAANDAEANRIKALRTQQLAAQGMAPFIQMIDRAEKETNPVLRKMLMDRINNEAGGKIVLEDAGDRMIVRNQRGEVLGVDAKGETPMSEKDKARSAKDDFEFKHAYAAAMHGLQDAYASAADLYNHPGLDNLIGPYSGIAVERGPDHPDQAPREAAIAALSPEGRNAIGAFNKVQGETFIRALRDLKESSSTGASGLGQLSNVEGSKIQAAKANLFPRQQVASFRQALQKYLTQIQTSAKLLNDKAAEKGLPVYELATVELTGPVKTRRGQQPAQAPAVPRGPTIRGATTPVTDTVRVRRNSDGRTGTMPRAKFEQQRDKYTEIK